MVLSIERQVQAIIKQKLKSSEFVFKNGKTLKQVLVLEAERLKNMIGDEIDNYYSSYPNPVMYERNPGKHLRKMLKVVIDERKNTITITFDSGSAWGNSVFEGKGYDQGYIPLLIDSGWEVASTKNFHNVYRFGNFEGYHFIEKAVKKFKTNNPYNLNIKVEGHYKGIAIPGYDFI